MKKVFVWIPVLLITSCFFGCVGNEQSEVLEELKTEEIVEENLEKENTTVLPEVLVENPEILEEQKREDVVQEEIEVEVQEEQREQVIEEKKEEIQVPKSFFLEEGKLCRHIIARVWFPASKEVSSTNELDICFPQVDIDSLIFLGDGDFRNYAKDNKNVYYFEDFYFFGTNDEEIHSIQQMKEIIQNKIVLNEADVESFKVIKKNYAIDKHNLYLEDEIFSESNVDDFRFSNGRFGVDAQKAYYFYSTHRHGLGGSISNIMFIEDVDVESFFSLSESFFGDKNKVYFVLNTFDFPPKFVEVVGADSDTFEILGEVSVGKRYDNLIQIYAKDKNNIFHCDFVKDPHSGPYKCEKIKVFESADRETFEVLNEEYIKDKNKVFWRGSPIHIISNPASFELINDVYVKDRNYVYWRRKDGLKEIFTIVEGADSESFTVLSEFYSKDKNNVYHYAKVVSNISDPATFEMIDKYLYTKDKNYVYWDKKIIENADPKTFKIVENSYSKDSNNVFYRNEILGEVDADTFEILSHYYAKDKDFVYKTAHCGGHFSIAILEGADVETFEIINGEDDEKDAKDKNSVYKKCKIKE